MRTKTILLTVAFSVIAIHAAALSSGAQEGSVGAAQAQIMGMASSSLYRRQGPNNAQTLATTESIIASVAKENKHSVEVSVKDGDCDERGDHQKKHHNHDQEEDDEDDEDDDDDDDDDDEDDESESSSENHHDDSQYNHKGQSGSEHNPQWQHNAGGDHRNNDASPSTEYPGPNGVSSVSSFPPGATVSHRPSSAIKTTLKSQSVVIASLLSIVVTGYLL